MGEVDPSVSGDPSINQSIFQSINRSITEPQTRGECIEKDYQQIMPC